MSGFDDHFLHSLAFANEEGLKLIQDLETFQVVKHESSAAECKRMDTEKRLTLGEVIPYWPYKLQTAPNKYNILHQLSHIS